MLERLSNEKFFTLHAQVLEEFATRHNLNLKKYPNDWWSAWTMLFQHPLGGVAAIDVIREDDDSISLDSKWWIDDFTSYRRSLFTERITLSDGKNLSKSLENALRDIISWGSEKLETVERDYEPLWKPFKAELVNYTQQYPAPVV